MFYVYILESLSGGGLYIGRTNNLKRRIREHNLGQSISTGKYVPWKLIYFEASLNEVDSKRRERYLKTSQGKRMIRLRMKEYLFQKRRNA